MLDFLGGVYGSGSDSTSTSVLWFMLATSLFEISSSVFFSKIFDSLPAHIDSAENLSL